jgi:uncharacterized protein (TIGR02217 family)
MAFADFHEVLFPTDISRGARGGPERRTDIVTLASGREQRNARWAQSRRRYDAGYGVKTLAALAAVIAFFEERRGRLIGFRWRDRMDWTSAAPGAAISPLDQPIGTGDGATTSFQLAKSYGGVHAPYRRPIVKPVAGSALVAVNGVEIAPTAFALDPTTGRIDLTSPPRAGAAVTAGFRFDVPVRFDTDWLEVELSAFEAGDIPRIPLIELLS